MERDRPSDLTNSKKGGEASRFRKALGVKKREAKIFVLDFSPEGARPGGHSKKEVPIQSRVDQEHSRRADFFDQSLQTRFAELGSVPQSLFRILLVLFFLFFYLLLI